MAKIMLVEDDNNLREIYGARLLAEGHEIVTAKDGEEALAVAVKEKPELIISDVMMPKISGFDMLDILRNAPETKHTKVIMMTALSQAEDKARADSLGADRYLVKSQVTLEDVAKVVKDVLDGKTAEEAPGPEIVTDPSPEEKKPEPTEEVKKTPEESQPTSDEAQPEPTEGPTQTPEPETTPTPSEPVIPTEIATPTTSIVSPTASNDVASQTPAPTDDTAKPVASDDTLVSDPPVSNDPVSTSDDSTATMSSADSVVANSSAQSNDSSDDSLASVIDPPSQTNTPDTATESTPEEAQPEPVIAQPSPEASQGEAIDKAIQSLSGSTGVSGSPNQTPEPTESPTQTPELPATPPEPATKIEVVLPTPPEPTLPQPDATVPAEDSVSNVVDEPKEEENNADAQIGDNLTDVLAKESEINSNNDSSNDTPAPVSAESTPATTPDTTSAPELPATPPEPNSPPVQPVDSTTPTPETTSPLNDSETKKKIVIQPINDITKGPDLNALAEKEQANEAVATPPADTVINPVETPAPADTTTTPQTAQAPAPNSEHDNISL